MPFKEGAEVKKGDLLFEIDPRPYQAQLDQAEGQVKLYEAQLELAKTTLRARPGVADDARRRQPAAARPGQGRGGGGRGRASRPPRPALEVYKLNLGFTKVTSPIDGQVSRYYLTVGNLVNQDQTLLTTVVSLDPMYVYFDMDEPTLLRIRKGDQRGPDQAAAAGRGPGADGPAGRGRLSRTRGRSTSSTTRSTRPPAASRCAASSPTPSRDGRRPAAVARHVRAHPPAASASRTRRCWSSTGPSAPTRG